MKELHELMTQRLQAAMDEGTFQEIIDKRVTEALDEIAKSALRSYSEPGKALKEKLEAALMGNISNITFPEFGHFLAQQVTEQYAQALHGQFAAQFKESLDELIQPVPKTITGNEFMEKLTDILHDEIHEACGELELEWDSRDKSIDLKIPCGCGELRVVFYSFLSDDPEGWGIGYIYDDNERCLTHGVAGATHASSKLERWLFKLYCSKASIVGLADHEGERLSIIG